MESKCLSVVIPTYNEEEIVGECLGRLLTQLDHIREIVVVDNNSTDSTVAIVTGLARQHPEIRVITETEQGLVFARNAGMNAATGDFVARIDSDSLVPPHWAQTIVEFFLADTEQRWAALCGRGEAYGLPYGDGITRLKKRLPVNPFRSAATEDNPTVRSVPVLYGSNMVLRATTWAAIRDRVSMRRDVFEDVDMGLCVGETGGRNAFLPHITVGVSPRRMETGMVGFVRYMSFLPRTLLLHQRFGYAFGAITIYLPWISFTHALRLILIRSYDAQSQTYSARNILRPTEDRVVP
ncbi:glycosyltransferase family 2 protein [Williamsia sp. CHRR-6]|uniref:glycosyltransferase family 2 protein n=1 Tax=Williamsia sp. CHRR-6 TaxID=2835871 RepID=UPI001BDA8EB2|nr:glycosyltransferase family 2 protein [Williamsia sp. CHRR-6]MBT0566869.1 glycosyltransferase family 2 protein [Williamsia sp. CHRR-6]